MKQCGTYFIREDCGTEIEGRIGSGRGCRLKGMGKYSGSVTHRGRRKVEHRHLLFSPDDRGKP